MAWLFRLLDRTARPWPLLGLVVLILLFRTGMQATLDRLRAVSGESILDYEIFYSQARVVEIFSAYGHAGRGLYRQFMTYDLAFPALYALFFASLIHLALARTRYRWLAIAPLLMALFDYVENVFFFGFLTSHPDISAIAVALANATSIGKFGFGAVTGLAGLVAVFMFIKGRFRTP